MTPKEYRKRLEALGYNISTWSKYCGVNRSTITRHLSGYIDPIPKMFINQIIHLEIIARELPHEWERIKGEG